MTTEEAQKVAEIAVTADGGYCSRCAGDLLDQLAEAFPDQADVFVAEYDKTFSP